MTIARRLLCAGGALMIAAMFGRCDNTPPQMPDLGPDMRMNQATAPTLNLVSPSSAPNTGGTVVTLTGTNFRTGATVTFNGVAATQVTVVSATSITCTVPARAAMCGNATIVVMNSDGTMVSDATMFKYRSTMLGFNTPATVGVGTTPRYVNVADVNADGKLDLLTANSGSANVTVRLGNGDGTFGNLTNVSFVAGSPFAVMAVDINKDQKLDLVTVLRQAASVRVRLGVGDGTFTAPTNDTFSTVPAPFDLAVGDLNKDGNPDIIVPSTAGGMGTTVLIGVGDGTFTAGTGPNLTGTDSRAIVLADFNADQNLDVAAVNYASNNLTAILGMGNGTFAGTSATTMGYNSPSDIVAGHFSDDTNLDIAIVNSGAGTARIVLGVGNGSFVNGASLPVGSTAVSERSIAAGDFNLDGIMDLVVSNVANSNVSVLIGVGDGTFMTKVDFAVGATPSHVNVADVNKDGLPDILTNDLNAGNAVLLVNRCQ